MISDLKLRNFFEKMRRSAELTQAGFKLLEKRSDPSKYLDGALEYGFFENETFLGPQKSPDGRGFWMPSHPGLGFLDLVAKNAEASADSVEIAKILNLIRRVSKHKPEGQDQLDNYYTWRSFAEILTTISVRHYDDELIGCVGTWISSKFDDHFAGEAISNGLLPKLLNHEDIDSQRWALRILDFITHFQRISKFVGKQERTELKGSVDVDLLRHVFEKNSDRIGSNLRRPAAELLIKRLLEVRSEGKLQPSSWYRSAIEDHSQNLRNTDHEDALISGLRDILLSWFRAQPDEGRLFYPKIIVNDFSLFERIGIFLATELHPQFSQDMLDSLPKFLANVEYHHETYRFLELNFGKFTENQQDCIVTAIADIPTDDGDDARRVLARTKLTWLNAVKGKGSKAADALAAEIAMAWPTIRMTSHPEFLSYFETWHGPGDSPYSSSDILNLVRTHELVGKLNGFHEDPSVWRGPTQDGLLSILRETICEHPTEFINAIRDFLHAKVDIQSNLVSSFKDLRRKATFPKDKEFWEGAWPKLISFSEDMVEENRIKIKAFEVKDENVRNEWFWSFGQIADLLRVGLDDDSHPIADVLLERIFHLIQTILTNVEADDSASTEALTHAINTPKGRAFEALMSYALSVTRRAAPELRKGKWVNLQPAFDSELSLCKNANFDVSALMGQYLGNFMYLSEEWVARNVARIFPHEVHQKKLCCGSIWSCLLPG